MRHLYNTSTPKAHGLSSERGQKVSKGWREWMPAMKQYFLDMTAVLHTWTHRACACTRPSKLKSKHEQWRNSWSPTPIWGALGNWWLLGEGRVVFTEWCCRWAVTRAPIDDPHPCTYKWHKVISVSLKKDTWSWEQNVEVEIVEELESRVWMVGLIRTHCIHYNSQNNSKKELIAGYRCYEGEMGRMEQET